MHTRVLFVLHFCSVSEQSFIVATFFALSLATNSHQSKYLLYCVLHAIPRYSILLLGEVTRWVYS
jgi:hypothetical protein